MFRLGPRLTIFHKSGLVAASSLTAFFVWNRFTSGKDHPTWPSPSQFIPAVISSIEISGPDTKRFTLTIPSHTRPPTRDSLAPIWSIYIKDDQIQVERPYTPLEGIDEHGHMSFWIKKYQDGQVGRWLHSKNVGDTVEIRGPAKTWEWQGKIWDEVIMISGGTGITPMYQLLYNIMAHNESPSSGTRFTLLHSSRTPADLPPPAILRPLSSFAETYPERFRLHLFVDTNGDHDAPHELHVGRIDKEAIERFGLDIPRTGRWRALFFQSEAPSLRQNRKVLFIVCGPEPMINAIVGPFGRGLTQGTVGGILGQMGYSSSEVRKL